MSGTQALGLPDLWYVENVSGLIRDQRPATDWPRVREAAVSGGSEPLIHEVIDGAERIAKEEEGEQLRFTTHMVATTILATIEAAVARVLQEAKAMAKALFADRNHQDQSQPQGRPAPTPPMAPALDSTGLTRHSGAGTPTRPGRGGTTRPGRRRPWEQPGWDPDT